MNTITAKDGTTIYLKDWGAGQPIVFSHGWPLTADAWDAQMMFFGQRGYRAIAHDRRGNGRSSQSWGIENKLHWVLDVGSGEELDRKRAGHAAQNFSLLNRIALNLLKQDKPQNAAFHGKRLKAGWDNDSLLHLLRN
jgi:pimeloyl-ACP methyl ester carboxylesterase